MVKRLIIIDLLIKWRRNLNVNNVNYQEALSAIKKNIDLSESKNYQKQKIKVVRLYEKL